MIEAYKEMFDKHPVEMTFLTLGACVLVAYGIHEIASVAKCRNVVIATSKDGIKAIVCNQKLLPAA